MGIFLEQTLFYSWSVFEIYLKKADARVSHLQVLQSGRGVLL